MHYREIDDDFFEVFCETSEGLFRHINDTAFPQTYKCMFTFSAKLGGLKTGMFECADTNNPYAFKVLFRSFCEHYLRFLYVWTRFTHEATDQPGNDYYSYCGATEALDYVNSLSASERLLGTDVAANAKKIAAALYPELEVISNTELERRAGVFRHRSILRFLAGEPYEFITAERPFLSQIIPTYALLSSFVHGGPYAELEMAGFSKPSALEQCHSDAELVVALTASAYMLAAAAVAREHKDVAEIPQKVKNVIAPLLHNSAVA